MPLVMITQQTQTEHEALLDKFRMLQKHHLNPSGVNINHALKQGEVVLLFVDDAEHVQAGAMLCMEEPSSRNKKFSSMGAGFASKLTKHDSLKDGKSLPSDVGNVAFVYGLVASEDSHILMPGLQLQKAISEEFAAKRGVFADIDVITADVVQRNLLLWCEGVREAGLHAVMRPDLTKGGGSNRTIFVAVAANPLINLVPERYADRALSGDSMREKAHELLMKVKQEHPTRAAKARNDKHINKERAL